MSIKEGRVRPIQQGEIRFVGDEIQFHGAARRWLKRLARQSSRQGHTVSASQVAEGLVAGVQKGICMHADLVHAVHRVRRILKKIKEAAYQ